jgi:hypothetical protein
MQKVLSSLVCAAFALVAGVSCDSGASDTDLNPDGPPMIRQVRLIELYTDSSGASGLERRVFAFGTHPDATPDDEHAVTTAKPLNNSLRIIVDELLVGNSLEEISCRGQVDDDSWSSVPINATPDDIAKCSVPKDVLPSSCGGPNAVCICQRPTGCIVGSDTIDMGQPVGVLDANQDGAADDTRFIQGSVKLTCGTNDVPIDLQASFWEPSGDQQLPAHGGFDVLGPAIVLTPSGTLPTGATCGLVFDPSVVDKQGNQVCAPPNGDVTQNCTPGDVTAFHFGVEGLQLTVQGITDGQVDVSPTDAIIVASNAPLDPASAIDPTHIVLVTAAAPTVDVPLNYTLMNNNSTIRIVPTTPPLLSNTPYILKLPTTVHDAFGQGMASEIDVNFTTGT